MLELRRVQVSGKSLPFRLRLVNMTRWKSLTAGPERAYERVVRARGEVRLEGQRPLAFSPGELAPGV